MMARIIQETWSVAGKEIVVAVAGVLMLLTASQAIAQTETALPAIQFGLVGIARAQTGRLNIINLNTPTTDYPPNPCMVMLSFRDENGEVFHDRAGSPVTTRAELLPGQSVFLELRAGEALAGSTALRKQFRAVVERNPGPTQFPPNPCEGLVPTLEIYDNFTGRTMVLYEKNPGPGQ